MKTSFLLLPVLALSAALAGCGSSSADTDPKPPPAAAASSLFAPTASDAVVPFPNSLFFADAMNITGGAPGLSADATLNVPNPGNANPAIANLNLLDGFSTTDTIYTDIGGPAIDIATANAGGVWVIDTRQGKVLSPVNDYEVVQSPVVTDRTRLLIRPIKPLAPQTTYVVVLTDKLRTVDGGAVTPSPAFRVVSDSDAVGSAGNPATDFSAQEQALLEQIRTTQVRPILDRVLPPIPFIQNKNVVLTWNFTTQSIGASLNAVAAAPTPNPNSAPDGGIRVAPLPNGQGGQLSTGDINAGLADTADVYQGTVDLSYYLENADSGASPPAPLTTFWASDGVMADGSSALPSPSGDSPFIPCAAFTASTSTTACFPTPQQRSVESVPVFVTVPNANSPSGGTPPAGGWPVIIFQHGITADRTNIFAVAPSFAQAGFVTVAIDLPLHGLAASSPFSIDGMERTFDLDADGDGNPDSSGANFIVLQNPITTRDNNREAVADLINLNATVMASDIAIQGGGSIDLNGKPSQYVGHSLGAIVGSVLMAVTDDSAFGAATLANPGGGTTRLLDGSVAFGSTISGGLAAAGIQEGSETYESFLRLNQTVNDGADPINYAQAANDKHALHMIEVVGGANNGANPPDLVVPNAVPRNVSASFNAPSAGACPASAQFVPFLDTVCVGAPLSGTDPLVAAMGLASVTVMPPFATGSQPADSVVRFTSGAHSTFLDPTSGTMNGGVDPQQGAATTAEMQCETAGFLAAAAAGSGAPAIPLGCAP